MRMLVVGAGALGGYFGARLAAAGRDVTFLVRPARARQLAEHGLRVVSPHGDIAIAPRVVQAGALDGPYDVILLATKSYGLDAAMADLALAVGAHTAILPTLNGMRHLDALAARFGRARVLGGAVVIIATLGPEGEVRQLMPPHDIAFGELAGGTSARVQAILDLMQGAAFNARASDNVLQDMWDKWVMLSTLAGATCLMRGTVGDILVAPGGREALLGLLDECRAAATACGFPPRPAFLEGAVKHLTTAGSPAAASMMRDVEAGAETEADHVLGDLIGRAEQHGVAMPLLRLAYCHLRTYAARRERERR
jgi:2-dehydropantoate 2-reductase